MFVYNMSFSQDSLWIVGGETSLNVQNIGLYNWSSGGETSVSLSGKILGYIIYDNKKNKWSTELNTTYGMIYQEVDSYRWRKTDDQIILKSEYGWYINKKLLFMNGIRLQTQYSNGYNYTEENGEVKRELISSFISPCYITPSIGLEYNIGDLKTTISPLSGRLVLVDNEYLSNLGYFDVEEGEKYLFDFGINYTIDFKKEIFKNVDFENKLSIFSPYEKMGEMKVNWETNILMKVNSWLKPSISTNLIYDEDVTLNKKDGSVGPGVQFKYSISIGFVFGVGEKR